MSIVNGGYAKVTKHLYALEIRDADGCSYCEYAYCSTRSEAARVAKGNRIVNMLDEEAMSPGMLEQAREWLRNPPKAYVGGSRAEPLLDRG